MPAVSLDAADAEELADFPLFFSEWATAAYDQLGESLARFMDGHAYGIALLADLVRFKAMLGTVSTEIDFSPCPEHPSAPARE